MLNLVTKALVVLGMAQVVFSYKPVESRHLIKLKSSVIDVTSPEKRSENWPGNQILPEKVQIIVHFTDYNQYAVNTVQEICGATNYDYIPEGAAIFTCLSSEIDNLKAMSSIDYVGPFAGEFKISQDWTNIKNLRNKDGKLQFKILIASGFSDSSEQTMSLLEGLKNEIKGLEVVSAFSKYATVAIPEEASAIFVNSVSNEEYCSWVQPVAVVSRANREGRWITQSAETGNYAINEKGIDGKGIVIGLTDSGVDAKHCYFYDANNPTINFCRPNNRNAAQCTTPNTAHRKIVGYYGIADTVEDTGTHGTHVSGTLVGFPTDPNNALIAQIGLAYNAKLAAVDIFTATGGAQFDLDDDVFPFLKGMGATISSNSWGYQTPVNAYNLDSYEIDNFAAKNPDFLILFAAGNSGPSTQTIDPHSNSKNGISVGSVVKLPTISISGFSSRGPAADGRIKPDIVTPGSSITSAKFTTVANGCGSASVTYDGTSMATPNAAGAAALIYQYYKEGHACGKLETCKINPSSALVKATLINSAQHFAGGNSFTGSGAFHIGFGRVKLDDTLDFGSNKLRFYDNVELKLNQSYVQKVIYTPGVSGSLKVTLVWTDPASTTASQAALINDLDLRVISPSGKIELGNKYLGVYLSDGDGVNNVEQVLIEPENAEKGEYLIQVAGYDFGKGPSQKFALIINNGSTTTCPQCTPNCPGQYACGKDGGCIDNAKICDGKADCANGADELPKTCVTWNVKAFTDCRNGLYILGGKNCDGIADCADGGDELQCSASALQITLISILSVIVTFLFR